MNINIFQRYLTVKNIIFFAVVILFIKLIASTQDIALMFFASYVIACSLIPLVDKMPSKINRNLASLIVLFGAVIFVLLFFVPIFVIAGQEITHLTEMFPQYVNGVKGYLTTLPGIDKFSIVQTDISSLFGSASGAAINILGDVLTVGKNIGSGVVYLITSIMLIYYFMVDNDTLKQGWLKLFPSNMRKKTSSIMDSIAQKVGGYVTAQVVTMASVGIIMTIGLLLIKVDYAVLLGLITAVLDIIPIVGPAIALVICLIVCCKSGPLVLGLVAFIFAVAQLSENSFVRPYVFGKFMNLHPVIIYLFLLLSAKFLGTIGVILAPAIAVTVVVLIEELYVKNLD